MHREKGHIDSMTYKNEKPEIPGKRSEIATLRDLKFGIKRRYLAIRMGTQFCMIRHALERCSDNSPTEKPESVK